MEYTFEVIGDPVAKARPRVFRIQRGTRAITRTITPQQSINYESHVKLSAQLAGVHTQLRPPIAATLYVYKQIPQSRTRKKFQPAKWGTYKKDVDNLAKSILDALNGIAYKDDKDVVRLEVFKIECETGAQSGVIVHLSELQEMPPCKQDVLRRFNLHNNNNTRSNV